MARPGEGLGALHETPDTSQPDVALYLAASQVLRAQLLAQRTAPQQGGPPDESEPVTQLLARLEETLRPLERSTTSEAAEEKGVPVADAVLRPVLIVEDDSTASLAVQLHLQVLELANPHIVARDGAEARDRLLQCLALDMAPALVLMDGHLPDTTGLDVLRWMRETPGLGTVPVIMLTGESHVDWIGEAYALGVASYLVKPVGYDALGEVLRMLPCRWALLGS